MPGRIHAITSASTAATSYSADSFSFCTGEAHPQAAASSSPRPQLAPVPELMLYPPAGGSGAGGISSVAAARFAAPPAPPASPAPAPAASYTPTGRAQQLLRLLELNEQLTSSSGGPEGTTSGSAGAATVQPAAQQQQSSVQRVPSATRALDTLALLAEAEAESQAEPEQVASLTAASTAASGEQLAPPVPPVQPAQALLATA
jgi:hypothetical protein